MNELEIIAKLAARARDVEGVRLGIGDDTALLEPGRFDLVTVDAMVEGVHYRPEFSPPEAVGWKLLARCLSDVAAMGGAPGPYFVSMSLGPDVAADFVDRLMDGMDAAAAELVPAGFETGLVGGDTSRTHGPTVLSMTLMGESPPAGAVTRAEATPGDRICLIGDVGLAAAGLALLDSDGESGANGSKVWAAAIEAHRYPRAKVREGALLGLHGIASALIDVSDGLAGDLRHILDRSKAGARIALDRLQISAELRRLAAKLDVPLLEWVLSGGDDYALIAIVSPDHTVQLWQLAEDYDFEVHDIGEIRGEQEGLIVVDAAGEPVQFEVLGYEHHVGSERTDD
jgi:thiamine-monophosphate kinase